MINPSVASVYAMAHALADRLPDAAADVKVQLAVACTKGIEEAARAIAMDTRVSADEVRGAASICGLLANLDGQAAHPRAAGIITEMVRRWLKSGGLPPEDVIEFEKLAAGLFDR